MFFWIEPPNDSCDTPICRERKREFSAILRARIWSNEGPPGPRPVYRVQVISALMDPECPSPEEPPAAELSSPLKTSTSSCNRANGVRHGVMS